MEVPRRNVKKITLLKRTLSGIEEQSGNANVEGAHEKESSDTEHGNNLENEEEEYWYLDETEETEENYNYVPTHPITNNINLSFPGTTDDLEESFEIREEAHSSSHWKYSYLDNLDYRLKTYVNFVTHESLSDQCVSRLDSLMTVLFGHPPIFTQYDVKRVLKTIQSKAIVGKTYYCNRCGFRKSWKRMTCNKCKVSAKNLLETVTFVKCNVQWQLEDLLRKHGEEIVRSHLKIHNKQETFQPNDVRRYKGYRDLVETKDSFENNEINLVCTYSSDGALFKRVSRREATPVFLNVEGLDILTKKAGKALCLIALSFSDGGIKKNLIQDTVEKSLRPLHDFKIRLNMNGQDYVFRIIIMSVLCDMKEQSLLTTLPNWHQVQGCSKCLTIGRKRGDGKISYDNHFPSRRREGSEMIMSAEHRTNGYTCTKVPSIYQFVSPTSIDIDPFHIRGAGICKQIVTEFMKPNKWTSLQLRSEVIELIKKSIESITSYTSETVKSQGFKKLSKCTGREWDKLSINVCAIIGVAGSSQNKNFNALFLGWYYCLEFLGSIIGTPSSLRKLLNSCYQLHVQLESNTLTMKWHNFYEHLLDHEEKYGALHTTEIYEREHKTLMTSVHHQTTNSEEIIITRYIAGKAIERSLLEKIPNMSHEIQNNIKHSMKNARRDQRSNLMQNKSSNLMTLKELNHEHRLLANSMNLSESTPFLKRVQVNTMLGSFVFSSNEYWNSNISTSSLITFTDPCSGVFKFASIEFVFQKSDDIFLLVTEFILEPLQLTVQEWSNSEVSPIAKQVLECCLAFPTTLGKITGQQYTIVPLSSIISPASTICYGDAQFVKICST